MVIKGKINNRATARGICFEFGFLGFGIYLIFVFFDLLIHSIAKNYNNYLRFVHFPCNVSFCSEACNNSRNLSRDMSSAPKLFK